MKKIIFVAIAFAELISFNQAFANQPVTDCGSISECQNIISEAKKSIEDNTRDPHVCHLTGKKFTPDHSYPLLGRAYMDDTGIIWGDLKKESNGELSTMTQADAIEYCKSIGAVLPTQDQYIKLIEQLIKRKDPNYPSFYNACDTLEQTDIDFLPHLSVDAITSTAEEIIGVNTMVVFQGVKRNKFFARFSTSANGYGDKIKLAARCIIAPSLKSN